MVDVIPSCADRMRLWYPFGCFLNKEPITMRNILSALGLLLIASVTQASDFSIGISKETVTLDYTGSTAYKEGLEFTAGGLHNTEDGNLVTLGLQVSQQVNSSVKVALGGRLMGAFSTVKDASALALGGQVQVTLLDSPKVQLGLHGWYAPEVTSSGSAKNFKDAGVSLGYQVMNNAEIFVAYRLVKISYNNLGQHNIHEGPLVGLKMSF